MNRDSYIKEIALKTKHSASSLKSYMKAVQSNIPYRLRDSDWLDVLHRKVGIKRSNNLRSEQLQRAAQKDQIKKNLNKSLILLLMIFATGPLFGQVKLKQIEHSESTNQIIITDDDGRPYYFFLDSLGAGYGIRSTIFADSNTIYHAFNNDTTAVFLSLCENGALGGTGASDLSACPPKSANEYNNVSNIESKALNSGTIKSSSVNNNATLSNLSDCYPMNGFYEANSKFRIYGAQVATYLLKIKASIDNGPVSTIATKRVYNNVGDYEQSFTLSARLPITVDLLSSKSVNIQHEIEIIDHGVISGDIPEWISFNSDLIIYASSNSN